MQTARTCLTLVSLLSSCSRLHVSLPINLPSWDTPRRTTDDILSIVGALGRGCACCFPCRTRWFFPQALRPSRSLARSSRSDRSHGSLTLTESESSLNRCRSILCRSPQHLRLQTRSRNHFQGRLHQQPATCFLAIRGGRSTAMI